MRARDLWYASHVLRAAPVVPSLCLCICLVLTGLSAAGRAEPSAANERLTLQDAERHLQQGHPERAARSLARALKRTPTPRLALRYAELTLPLTPASGRQELTRRQNAARLLLELSADPAFQPGELAHQLRFHMAWAQAVLGELTQALARLEEVAGFDPGRALPFLRALSTLALPDAPALAARSLELCRALAPADASLLTELGLFWLAQGEAHKALALLGERFAREPGALSARRDYAYALSAVGRPDEAFALLGVARDSCRDTELCLLELARFAFEARAYPAALKDLAELRTHAPRELAALFLEADVRLAQNKPAEARAVYQHILALAPDNLRARAALLGLGELPGSHSR